MKPFTVPVVLAADAAIDLQLHTIYSDGTWTPAQLIDYLRSEQFGLAANRMMPSATVSSRIRTRCRS